MGAQRANPGTADPGSSLQSLHNTHKEDREMRSITRLLVAAVLIGLIATPAAADVPTVDGPYTDVFGDIDPCTGTEHEITFTVTFFDHLGHNNSLIFRDINRSGSTDSGYVLTGGQLHVVANPNASLFNFIDVWRNPDTGSKMQARGTFRLAGNSPVVEEFTLRCIGAPTILP